MTRIIVPLLALPFDAVAHPGHGAPLAHLHSWDWGNWMLVIACVAVAAFAAWRAK